MTDAPIQVAALYCFAPFDDPAVHQLPLQEVCEGAGTKGTILLAPEGVNGTIAGAPDAIKAVLDHIRSLPGCAEFDVKFSHADEMPFNRMKVRLKREIVTMGEPDIDPLNSVGRYVAPEDWNDLISDPDTIVIDTRNDYEVAVGTFEGAVDPKTKSFREFPTWFREHREELLEGKKKVAMFCTGGIRCEKSTSFLRAEGIEDVFHLKGGILKYLETVPEEDSKWEGECFVFDQRVAVKHGLELGSYGQCFACRMPLTEEEMASDDYAPGISCPHCIHERGEEQRARYAERQRQQQLAKQRGETHVGASPKGAQNDTAKLSDGGWEANFPQGLSPDANSQRGGE
ncbi:rhodanese-related sulfurtransferase [Erythrobacter sp. F6033]|uniref:oxygen-dependent tRNA uridine(34) hydroxylase TrhO n=1 Tax=Erythrobacter sp. F6033 TaxID=2926401 RepID=UPI001FF1BF9A|nr:rhodanese-related sulfurtransferase [Erythrobacter sp. F6033]MCK0127962.1 rhodanese-related sulfurtransferase [Erythrobacter sp. F6033]